MNAFCRLHFKLIRDARKLWHRLWSVRLSLLAALLSTLETAFTYWTTGHTPPIVAAAALISIAAAISRVVAQESLNEPADSETTA